MTDLRTAAQQALECLKGVARGKYDGNAADVCAALEAALAQQKDPTDPGNDVDVLREHVRHLERRVRQLHAQQTEPVQEPAFHGFMSDDGTQVDVCFSPSAPRRDGTYATAYYTAPPHRVAQQAEPVEEPAYKVKVASRWHDTEPLAPAFSLPDGEHLLYTAPPQRLPLTDEEINAEWHELDGEASALFKRVIRKFARAIERAHGIGVQS